MQERRKSGIAGTGTGNMELHRANERNSAANMPLAVCWNVATVEEIFRGGGGTAIQNIRKQFGSAQKRQKMESASAQTVKEYRSR